MLIYTQNYAVLHSRAPWSGSRTVVAALWDDGAGVRRISDYTDESWRVANGKSGS